MKRILQTTLLTACLVGVSLGAYHAALPPDPELSRYVPTGALLYLQAKDFSELLSDWDKSREKEQWIKSKNYEIFLQSSLLLRLHDAGGEFSKAAGVPADDAILHQVAGKQTAFALYDIGKLEFLYITRVPSSGVTQSANIVERECRLLTGNLMQNCIICGNACRFREFSSSIMQSQQQTRLQKNLVVLALNPLLFFSGFIPIRKKFGEIFRL